MMLLLVFVILIGLLFINFSQNNFENNSLGGSFVLTDQNGNNFDSKKIKKKKNLFILGTPFVQMFVHLIY